MHPLNVLVTRARAAILRAAPALFAACILQGCVSPSPNYQGQSTFAEPAAAVRALQSAAASGDAPALHAIFGADSADLLSSGDPVADRMNREVVVVALGEGWSLEPAGRRTKELIIGDEQWPFPIPLVQDTRGWWFDTEAGREEVLARRIGRNELAAIGALQTYVFAQREYAASSHDGRPAGSFAQRIRSDPGMHNGLFWESTDGSPSTSPLGQFAAAAAAEGYGASNSSQPAPYHGYFFRILTRQGAAAPGGAMNYIARNDMTRGFAMIAFPADYANSGIMTFIVGADGVVHQADLGEDTAALAAAITEFNPDSAWTPVE